MAQAIPKREWLQVEEDLCRTAFLEFLMEQLLWEQPLPEGHLAPWARISQPGQGEVAQRVMAVQALQDFGWFDEPDSSASH